MSAHHAVDACRRVLGPKGTIGVGALSLATVVAFRYFRRRRLRQLREERASEAQRAREEALEKLRRESEGDEADTSLTSKSVEELLSDLRQGKLTAARVVRAFMLKVRAFSPATTDQ